ncbi:hybrid sensor histidine kinase/response regulator [Paenibacillus albus]|uniref:Circadian input-output histidine kinase CikA n=1 Tax=Paenibacillus albus TaxID=2495582 RepID=A0A3S9A9L4_9BACL|nr:hybrid sensor histidine kinase/response regulator [Paenibacillus albus]AZN42381.1 response regulator [Paenibacillus albus]
MTSHRKTGIIRTIVLALFALMMMLFAVVPFSYASETEAQTSDKKVLILHSAAPDYPTTKLFADAFTSSLKASTNVTIYQDYLDLTRYDSQPGYEQTIESLLKQKYEHNQPDLIVTTSYPTLPFMKKFGEQLFPGVPVIYAYNEYEGVIPDPMPANYSGVIGDFEVSGTIDLIMKTKPQTDKIYIVIGSSPNEQTALKMAKSETARYENQVHLEYLNGLTYSQLLDKLQNEQDVHSAILYVFLFQDKTGKPYIPAEVVKKIIELSPMPVYSPFTQFMGNGIVGGAMHSFADLGVTAAYRAKLILQGRPAGELETVISSNRAVQVDWRALAKWGIKENQLPRDSEVLYKNPTIWEQYHWYMIGGVALAVLEFVLVMVLLLTRTLRKRAEEALREHKDHLEELIEERTQELALKNIQLSEAKELAESASRAKGEFLANMSHEIRTPLNAIVGYNYLLQKTVMSDKQLDYVDMTIQSAKGLLTIINDILDFSKVEAKMITLEHIDFDLYEVLNNISNMVSFKAFDKGLRMHISIHHEVPQVLHGDPFRLNQVLLNLVNNAVKFTEQGEVTVAVSVQEQQEKRIKLQFQVTDTGIGISPAEQAQLFKTFSQGDMSTTRKYGGTGLGLVISKSLIELMGGTIALDSELGHGSCFTFTAIFEAGDYDLFKEIRQMNSTYLRVLLICDNHQMQLVMKQQLEQFQYIVTIAASATEAFDSIHKYGSYDLLLIDWKLRDYDGTEVFKQIYEAFPFLKKTIALISDTHNYELQRHLDDTDLDRVLPYPISQSQLYNEISSVIRQKPASVAGGTVQQEGMEKFAMLNAARVLLVEDNEINQHVARSILEETGVLVDIAENGKQAVEKTAAAHKFDAILMDVQMPIMDGYEATRKIREAEVAAASEHRIPIIAMTADAMKGVHDKVLEAGMDGYITKPFEPIELFVMLQKLILQSKSATVPVPAQQQAVGLTQLPDRLPGLDISQFLERYQMKQESYVHILSQFAAKSAGAVKDISSAFSVGDIDGARFLTHTLKGVAGNIGASALHMAALKLETMIHEGKYAKLEIVLDTLEEKLKEVLDSIASLVQNSR